MTDLHFSVILLLTAVGFYALGQLHGRIAERKFMQRKLANQIRDNIAFNAMPRTKENDHA